MAIKTKLTRDAKLKLGIKDNLKASFTAHFRRVAVKELQADHNPAYTYII